MDRCPPCWPLEEMRNHNVIIKLEGEKEIHGVLKNFDSVGNIILGNAVLMCPGAYVPSKFVPQALGAIVIRSPHIASINVQGKN